MAVSKEEILLAIYEEFENWCEEEMACQEGCAACCTQNVLMTAVEGELIHRHIREQGKMAWFAARLQEKGETRKVAMTTNSFAASCLQGEDVEPQSYGTGDPCPFLEKNRCAIYTVRPFSCRCFISKTTCAPGTPAAIGGAYLSASTAVMQILEHLGQGEYLGNMLDVLLALCDLPENRKYLELLPASLADQARLNVTRALPLPGFLLLEEEMETVGPLLEAIFDRRLEGRTIEEILNNSSKN